MATTWRGARFGGAVCSLGAKKLDEMLEKWLVNVGLNVVVRFWMLTLYDFVTSIRSQVRRNASGCRYSGASQWELRSSTVRWTGLTSWIALIPRNCKGQFPCLPKGYGSIPINTIFRGMNIHLPAILMFTRGTRFWHTAKECQVHYSSFRPFLSSTSQRSAARTMGLAWGWRWVPPSGAMDMDPALVWSQKRSQLGWLWWFNGF